MLLTPSSADERVWHLVRESGSLRARADEVARQVGCDADDARHALDDLVQRNVLRRFDVPGDQPVYWT